MFRRKMYAVERSSCNPGIDEVAGAELIEGGQRVSGPQRRLVAAVDQLEHLREQLHLADAAATPP